MKHFFALLLTTVLYSTETYKVPDSTISSTTVSYARMYEYICINGHVTKYWGWDSSTKPDKRAVCNTCMNEWLLRAFPAKLKKRIR